MENQFLIEGKLDLSEEKINYIIEHKSEFIAFMKIDLNRLFINKDRHIQNVNTENLWFPKANEKGNFFDFIQYLSNNNETDCTMQKDKIINVLTIKQTQAEQKKEEEQAQAYSELIKKINDYMNNINFKNINEINTFNYVRALLSLPTLGEYSLYEIHGLKYDDSEETIKSYVQEAYSLYKDDESLLGQAFRFSLVNIIVWLLDGKNRVKYNEIMARIQKKHIKRMKASDTLAAYGSPYEYIPIDHDKNIKAEPLDPSGIKPKEITRMLNTEETQKMKPKQIIFVILFIILIAVAWGLIETFVLHKVGS